MLSNLWDEYREYKGVKIYPFLMEDYELFEDLIFILLFDKNSLGYVEIIKMSYLRFILFVVPQMIDGSGKQYVDVPEKLDRLLKYVFKEQKFKFILDDNGKIFIQVNGNILLNERDFDKIKNIILEQNAVPVSDDDFHPDLKKELQENAAFLAKTQNSQEGTIEDQIISYKCEMKYFSYKLIKKMTIYQFRKELARLNLIKDYLIYKTAETSGMVKFNKPIPHWLSHISDKPDYSGLLMDEKDFDAKMSEISRENKMRR